MRLEIAENKNLETMLGTVFSANSVDQEWNSQRNAALDMGRMHSA